MDFQTHLTSFLKKEEVDSLLISLNQASQTAFRLNTLKIKEITDIFNPCPFLNHPDVKNGFYFDKVLNPLGKSILFEAGAFYIQEPSAMLAVEILNPQENDIVLDMCAAPGGKSFHAINLMNDRGLLVCNDIHPIRSQILSSNLEKCGCKQILVLQEDSKNYQSKFSNFFDKIILDAPCSGSGMFRKNDFSYQDWSMEKVMQCQKTQISLLNDAYTMLKSGGAILYSTCSFSKQENEDVLIQFLSFHSDCHLIPIPLKNGFLPSIGIEGAIRLHPNHYRGEGQFIALIKKEGESINSSIKLKTKKNKKIHPSVFQFLDEFHFSYDKNKIVNWNEHYFYVDFDHPILDHLKILRCGLAIGEVKNNRFIPNHAFAMYHHFDFSHCSIELSDKDALKYLAGECLTCANEGTGYKIVTYQNLPLGFVKQVGHQLKNHYPKGLRKKINCQV